MKLKILEKRNATHLKERINNVCKMLSLKLKMKMKTNRDLKSLQNLQNNKVNKS